MYRVVVVVVLGCSAPATPAHAPIAPPPIDAAVVDAAPVVVVDAPEHTTCVPKDLGGVVTLFDADDRTARVCLRRAVVGSKRPEMTACFTVDLATGRYDALAVTPPDPFADRPRADGWSTVDDEKRVAVCKANKCTKLPLPINKRGDGAPPDTYDLDISADGQTVLASMPYPSMEIRTFSTATGKLVAKWKIGGDDPACRNRARFVENTVFARIKACAEPPTTGLLFDTRGTLLREITEVDVEYAVPAKLGTDWAFTGPGGASVIILDVATGTTKLVAAFPKLVADAACPYCGPLDRTHQDVPSVTATPSGTPLVWSDGLVILDAARTRYPLVVCP